MLILVTQFLLGEISFHYIQFLCFKISLPVRNSLYLVIKILVASKWKVNRVIHVKSFELITFKIHASHLSVHHYVTSWPVNYNNLPFLWEITTYIMWFNYLLYISGRCNIWGRNDKVCIKNFEYLPKTKYVLRWLISLHFLFCFTLFGSWTVMVWYP